MKTVWACLQVAAVLLAAAGPAAAQTDPIELRTADDDAAGGEAVRLGVTVDNDGGAGDNSQVKLYATFNANSNRITSLGAPTGANDAVRLADIGGVGAPVGPYVQLQSSTPGSQQTGHLSLSGTGLFGGNIDAEGYVDAGTTYKIAGGTILAVMQVGTLAVGIDAGKVNTANYNTFVGSGAGYSNTDTRYNTMIGYQAGYKTTNEANIFVGYQAGYENVGYLNIFVGVNAGYYNTSGYENIFMGERTGYGNSTGFQNVAIGHRAGYSNNTGQGNVFLGHNAGYSETGSNKLYIENSSSASPLIYGDFASDIVAINGSVGIGTTTPSAPLTIFGPASGGRNIYIETPRTADDGMMQIRNTAPGMGCAIMVQDQPGGYWAFGMDRDDQFVFSTFADFSGSYNSYKKMVINPTTGNVGIGTTTPVYRLELPNVGDSSGQGRANAWVTYSSGRWKEQVETIGDALATVERLRGVTFVWKPEHGGTRDLGFIAEEVGAVVPELVEWEPDGVYARSLKYDRIPALTVEAIKELSKIVREQAARIDTLEAELDTLRSSP